MADPVAPRLPWHASLWVAAALAAAIAPLVPRLPGWAGGLAAALIAWHLHLAQRRLPAPSRWLTAALVAAVGLAVFLHFRTLFGRDAGITLLVGMLALKLLELRTARDGVLLLALNGFLVLTHVLFAQSVPAALYLIACVWLNTAALVKLQQPAAAPRFVLRLAGVLLVQSIPLMLLMFALFPRVQGPLWGMPRDAHTGLTGLSDTMTPGSLSGLILSDSVAFRARFDGAPPPRDRLYWRGPVLERFDGRTWSARPARTRAASFDTASLPLAYEVTLEPHNQRWLFALDLPGQVPPDATPTADFQLLAREPVTARRRYAMVSYLDYRAGVGDGGAALQATRALPPDANPRTAAYGRALRTRHADDGALVAAVLTQFRTESYAYTLTPPLLGNDPVDDFLFGTRAGFCEHYASAFAVLMRAAGIPARVVTGYLGGEVNPVGDYLIVRQADAHAWTEVWLKELGWVRIDPTAAVAPQRVERGIAAAVPAGAALPLWARTDSDWLRGLAFRWDSVAHHWNQWVLGYDAERQRSLITRTGLDASWRTLGIGLAAGVIVLLAALAMALAPRIRPRRDPVECAWQRGCALLARRGLPRAAHEGALDYGRRVARLRPELAAAVCGVSELYTALRYGAGPDPAGPQRLAAAVRRLRAAL